MDISLLQQQPVDFIELAFSESLWPYQQTIVNALRDFKRVSVRSCHDIGKSYTAARIVLWYLYSHPNSKVITTAPTFRQVQDILWRELRSAKAKSIIDLGGTINQTSLNIGDQWFALGLSTDEPSRFQGYHAEDILLVVDEAAGVKEEIFDASEGIVSSQNARVLYIGNPTNTEGSFYKSFKIESFKKIHISAFDTPNFTTFGITIEDIRANTWKDKITKELPAPYLITPEWVYDKYLRWGEGTPMWDSRVIGNFPQQGENTLIPLYKIELARLASLQTQETDPEVIGADFARFGADKTEYAYRKGPRVLDWKTLTKIDTIANAGDLGLFMNFHPHASVNGDEGGLGVGIMDMVKANNPYKTVNGVNNAAQPLDKENFVNLRAEMFWSLRDRFTDDQIDLSQLPQDVYEDLSSQLSNILYKFTPKGQRQIESKEEMKKRGLPSPDKADALALAFGVVESRPVIFDYMRDLAA